MLLAPGIRTDKINTTCSIVNHIIGSIWPHRHAALRRTTTVTNNVHVTGGMGCRNRHGAISATAWQRALPGQTLSHIDAGRPSIRLAISRGRGIYGQPLAVISRRSGAIVQAVTEAPLNVIWAVSDASHHHTVPGRFNGVHKVPDAAPLPMPVPPSAPKVTPSPPKFVEIIL